jgi:hypothetical protein
MTTQQLVSTVVINLVLAGTLAALVVRGRARHCWSFVAYLCAFLTGETMTVISPDRFFTEEFWMAKQALYDILKTGVALEMAWRVVRAFPGALRTARAMALVLLVGFTTILASGPHRAGYKVIFTWQPRVVACTALLFTLIALLVAWYHLPMRAIHRSIMGGFAIYSAFFATLLSLLERWGWGHLPLMNAMNRIVFLGVALWWMRAAWAREEEAMPVIVLPQPSAGLVAPAAVERVV